jgi:hypothetical protein
VQHEKYCSFTFDPYLSGVVGYQRFSGTAASRKPKERVMSNMFSKALGAGLLTLAVVGGATAYLNSSLAAQPVKYALDGYTTEQPQTPHVAKVASVDAGRAS